MAEFKLGRLRFVWKGVWVAGTPYVKDDIIKYGGSSFVCISAHTANSDFDVDLSGDKWQLMSTGFEWKNDPWTPETLYKFNDVVRYGGSIYISTENHTSAESIPDFYSDLSTGKWELLIKGQSWEGIWQPTTFYKVGDIVKYGSSTFLCTVPHISSEDAELGLEVDQNNWDIKTEGLSWKGLWTQNSRFIENDIVKYGPNIWICKTFHTSTTEFNESNWSLLVSGFTFEDQWVNDQEYQENDIVTYGGYVYIATARGTGYVPPISPSFWTVLIKGYDNNGQYNPLLTYKIGSVVTYGAYSYTAVLEIGVNQSPNNNPERWRLISAGTRWLSEWTDSPEEVTYKVGDAVKYGPSSFICVKEHDPIEGENSPDFDSTGEFWNVLAEGDETNALRRRGDLLTRNAVQNVRLPKGNTGSYLKAGSLDIEWSKVGSITRVFYVSTDGIDSPERGTTLDDPWRTIKFACDYLKNVVTPTVQQPAVINVKTGVYQEEFPISIPKYVSLVGDELRMSIIEPTPETSHLDKFYMRDSTTIRNFTFRGATGAPGTNGFTTVNQFGTRRPNGGAWISLDPGTGPNDESVWVGERSPYMQNITLFGDYCVGQKIDGSVHNGGNKSIVSNDFTTILSNGIGAWCANQGRAELVSVFTYYSYIGYLCETGGVIRATNGNNSYGTFGSVSEGVDPSEISRTASVDNRRFDAIIDRVQTDGSSILYVEYLNAGEEYQNAQFLFSGPGNTNNLSLSPTFNTGGVTEVRVLVDGNGYIGANNNCQLGDSVSVRLSASDVAVTGAYDGTRITIVDGTGAGQYGIIAGFDGGVKEAFILKESFTPLKVTATTFGTNAITVNDTSTLSVDMPVMFVGTAFGGVTNTDLYYVIDIINSTSFVVSSTLGGSSETLFTATGNCTLIQAGWDTFVKPSQKLIANITNTNPVRVTTTTPHGIANKFTVTFSNVGGMTQLNGNTYYAQKASATEFDLFTSFSLLTPLNGVSFGEYTTGGDVEIRLDPSPFLDTTSRYFIEPRPVFSTGDGASATAVRTIGIDTLPVNTGGANYTTVPTVIVSGVESDDNFESAVATATISGSLSQIRIQNKGTNFQSAPTLTIVGGGLPANNLNWTAEKNTSVGEFYITSSRRIYEVISDGELGTTEPTHEIGDELNGEALLKYLGRVATATATTTRAIRSVELINGGENYTSPPTVKINGTGSDAIVSAQISQVISEISVTVGGSEYSSSPQVTLIGGDPIQFAVAKAVLSAQLEEITVLEGGNGYTESTVVQIVGDGQDAEAEVELDFGGYIEGVTPGIVTAIKIINPGSGFSEPPTINIVGVGQGALATSSIKGTVDSIELIERGRGYVATPTVVISGGGGSGAAAIAIRTGAVSSISVVDGGRGWVGTPSLSFEGGGGTGAVAEVTGMHNVIDQITVTDSGDGYKSNPAVAISGGEGAILRTLIDASVTSVTVLDPGSGYDVDNTRVSFVGGGNYKSPVAGLRYYRNVSALTAIGPKQRTETLDGIGYTGTVIKAVINNQNPTVVYQTQILRQPAELGYVTPQNITTVVDVWVKAITSTIENTENLNNAATLLRINRKFVKKQVRKYIDGQFTGVPTDIWNRDFGLILDAVSNDLATRGVNNTVTCAISQIFIEERADETEKAAILESLSYMSILFKELVQNIVVVPFVDVGRVWRGVWRIGVNYQINDVVLVNNGTYVCLEAHDASANFLFDLDVNRWQFVPDGQRTLDIAFESESLVAIDNNFEIMSKIIDVGAGSNTYLAASELILSNISFIKAEVIAYINTTYQNFDYNQQLCARDTGFIAESIAEDIISAGVSLEPDIGVTVTGVIGRIDVVNGGEGYSEGVIIDITVDGDAAEVTALARPNINEFTGAIESFRMINKGKGYGTDPVIVSIIPDSGSGAIARCRLAGSNVAKIVIIEPGSGYTSGPFLKLVDPNNDTEARFKVRVSDIGVLGQPTFANRSDGWITADAEVTGDGFADVSQTGTFVFVKDLTNLPTPGANVQFAGNPEFYKLVALRDVEAPSGKLGARQLLIANKEFIQEEIVSYLDNFIYDSVKCGRDVGLIIDALAQDIVYGSNAKILAALHSYRRGLYVNFADQRYQTAFVLEYVKSLISQDQKDATLDSLAQLKLEIIDNLGETPAPTTINSVVNNMDIIIDILDRGLTAVPSTVLTDPTGYNTGFSNARALLVSNKEFVIEELIAYINLENPSLNYDEQKCRRDIGYIVDALRYDLTYGGNLMTLLAARSYFSYAQLQLGSGELSATLSAYTFLKTILTDVLGAVLIDPPNQEEIEQDVSTSAGSAQAIAFALERMDEIIAIVGQTSNPTTILPSTAWVSQPLLDARSFLLGSKSTIQSNIISYIESEYPTLVFNRSTCSRDIGFIIDAIGWDLIFGSNFQSIKSGMAYYRAGAGVVLNGLGDSVNLLDILIEWISNDEYYKPVPSVVITNGDASVDANRGKDILVSNADFISEMALQYFKNENTTQINENIVKLDIRQLVLSVAHDLAYLGNAETTSFADSFYLGTELVFPGYVDLPETVKPLFLDLLAYVETIMTQAVTNVEITILSGYSSNLSQDTSLPSGGTASVNRISSLLSDFVNNIENGKSSATVVENTFDTFPENLVGARGGILATKPNLVIAANDWIEDKFVNFNYDKSLTRRDTGLIVQALADDVFGDYAKTVEAGNRFYAPSAQVLRDTIKEQTIAAIDRINIIAQKVIRNETYIRTQNNAFQERFPAITGGADGSANIDERIKIIIRTLQYGDFFEKVKQLLLDNKEYLKAEVIAYINASYEDLDYDQNLCARDVGLLIDAFVYDLFGGFSRSREAGLRYYSTPSALVAITEQRGPTLDAILYLRDAIKQIIINQPPSITFQEVLDRVTINDDYDISLINTLQLHDFFDNATDEVINVIVNGPKALPAGEYSVRLQISPPISVDVSPLHLTDVTIRSKYSQVRLTGHDFLNIGTGDKADTNYPGVPVNAPEQLQEVREVGGGRVFYTSTDQDGNFRVGELFRVEQSTGIATLNADAFNLSGLNELSLGGIALGGTNAIIREFSTDPTFFANSDNVVPTQKAIRSFIQSALGSGGGNIAVNAVIAGQAFLSGDELTTLGNIPFRFTSTGGYLVQSGVESVDPFTGSLVVTGGVGISGNLNVAGTATANMGVVNAQSFTGPIGSIAPSSAAFTSVSASAGVLVTANTQSDSTTTGSLVVTGGVGIGGNVNIAGSLSTAGLSASSLDNTPIGTISRSSGAFTSLAANAQVTFSGNIASTTTGTGTVVVTGGLGVSGSTNIGGSLTVNGNNQTISLSPTGTGTVTVNPATAGTINRMNIGTVTPGTAAFTTLNVTGLATLNEITELTSTITGATGTVVHNFDNGGIFYHTGMLANFTANFTNVPTTDSRGIAMVLMLNQGATGRFPNAVQINGSAVTLRWANNTVPTPGSNVIDIATFTLFRIAGNWIVTGTYTNYS
jgi:hypothetical protein